MRDILGGGTSNCGGIRGREIQWRDVSSLLTVRQSSLADDERR